MLIILLLAALAMPGAAGAQEPGVETTARRPLPRDAARDAASLYNTARTRHRGAFELPAGETIRGDLGVLEGPVTLAGRVEGRVVAINADVTLHPGARIAEDLLVIGGSVTGRNAADIGGEIRIYRQRLQYTVEDGRLIPVEDSLEEESWWRRLERRRAARRTRIIVASTGAYNRVEGLPIGVGPNLRQRVGDASLDARALAILRTGSSFRSDDSDVGYQLSAELRSTRRTGYAISAEAFDVASPVEDWQMSALEAGLAAFLFRRDYRDYYDRHGGGGGLELFQRGTGSVTLGYTHERWGQRELRNPWTLWRTTPAWRPHPALDEGVMHLVRGGARLDTRNHPDDPSSGWDIGLQLEWGTGTLHALGAGPMPRNASPERTNYTRGVVDLRRYNRLSPVSQLNFRLMTGGWLGGDALPLQRRFSVGGVGSVPGHDFRSGRFGNDDAAACNPAWEIPGRPALCDRIALMQVEYRSALHFGLFDRWELDPDRDRARGVGSWVMFLNAGRGWLAGESLFPTTLVPPPEQPRAYDRGGIPPLSTFLSDIGVGLDFGHFGAYIAKSLSHGSEPLNFFLRLRHRF
jgi:hypothetical protein